VNQAQDADATLGTAAVPLKAAVLTFRASMAGEGRLRKSGEGPAPLDHRRASNCRDRPWSAVRPRM